MPKTIPCYDCKGPGCKTCKDGGVLSVYTQAEVNDLVKAENKRLITFMENVSKKLNCLPDYTGDYKHIYKAIEARNK